MKNLVFLALIVLSAFVATYAANVRIVSRSEWGAQPARHAPKRLAASPAPYVIISHEGHRVCQFKQNCIQHLRNIQAMHVGQQGADDIAYNFLVGGDGNVYEGRGWGVEGEHTPGYNAKSLGVALVGDFSYTEPTEKQLEALKTLLEAGVQGGKIDGSYKLLGQSQVKITKSPGSKLYNVIKTWEHWTPRP